MSEQQEGQHQPETDDVADTPAVEVADLGSGQPAATNGDGDAVRDSADDGETSPAPAEGEAKADVADEGSQQVSNAVRRLEEEGEIAADYLEELLDIADLDGDIDLSIDHGRAAVEIVAESGEERDLQRLVGEDGKVLDALQELTRLAVQTRTGERSRLMLDISGHRKQRKAELTGVAGEAIARVNGGESSVALEAMNPFERKVVHDAVAAAGLTSDSVGAEPERHVVITGGEKA